MVDGGALPSGARARTRWMHLRRAIDTGARVPDAHAPDAPDAPDAPEVPRLGSDAPIRVGVERGMVLTSAVAGPPSAVLSLFGLESDGGNGPTALLVMSLILAALMIAAVPLSLARPGMPAYRWLRFAAVVFLVFLALEPFRLGDASLPGSPPWLIALSCIAFSCMAVGTEDWRRAGLACGVAIVLVAVIHAGRMPAEQIVVEVVGLALVAAALIAGVRTLRSRARRADAAEHRARELFEGSRRRAATAAERIRTDALLHDTVLATLLAAAGLGAPERTVLMARSALDIVSRTADPPDAGSRTVRFDDAIAAAEREFAPMDGLVVLDLVGARAVELPSAVAEALVSATLQALTNSITHAGPSAVRLATAAATPDGGLRIVISDDGCGFDAERVAPEQLGVRVSILGRLRQVGATAEVRSVPGGGTTWHLEWHPGEDASASDRVAGVDRVSLVPRKVLYGALAACIVIAIIAATLEAALVYRAGGPVLAAMLGLALLPTLVKGARSGRMRTANAWITAAVGGIICATAPIGLDPDAVDVVSVSWLTCGVLAGSVMVWMAGHRLPPVAAVACLVLTIAVWAGPPAVIRLGLAAEIVLVVAGLMMHRALRRVGEVTRLAAAAQRETLRWQAELDAFHVERQGRLHMVAGNAAPMLHRIIEQRGELDPASRAECRVLEQTLRDEIRGRRLLNDATRAVILAHRRRGASVQVLDDGGLDDLAPGPLGVLLDEAARRLGPVPSSRIVIRTGRPESETAITIVASSPDETAAALGLDTDDDVELWVQIPRPVTVEPSS